MSDWDDLRWFLVMNGTADAWLCQVDAGRWLLRFDHPARCMIGVMPRSGEPVASLEDALWLADLPAPGEPTSRTLWPPAAATSSARDLAVGPDVRESTDVPAAASSSAGPGVRLAFRVASEDAELVALGVGQHEPPRPVWFAEVVDRRGAQRQHPIDLLIAGPIGRDQVQVHAILHLFGLGDLDEQKPLSTVRVDDHALVIARLVGLVGHAGEPKHLRPERRERIRIMAVERGAVNSTTS